MSPVLSITTTSTWQDVQTRLRELLLSSENNLVSESWVIHKLPIINAICNIFFEKWKKWVLQYLRRWNKKLKKCLSEEILESIYSLLKISKTDLLIYNIQDKCSDLIPGPSWFADLGKVNTKKELKSVWPSWLAEMQK